MTEPLYSDEAIIRSVTYSTRGGHKVSFEMDPEGWEAFKGMETQRCMMVLVPIQNDGQPDPDAKPHPSPEDLKKWGSVKALSEKPRKAWGSLTLPQQAGIRCNDVEFQVWLGCNDTEEAAMSVRSRCGVDSRAELATTPKAAACWRKMDCDFLARGVGMTWR